LIIEYAKFRSEFVRFIEKNKPSLTDSGLSYLTGGGKIDQTATYENNLKAWDRSNAKIVSGDIDNAQRFSDEMKRMRSAFAIAPDSVTGLAVKALTDTLDEFKKITMDSGNNAVKIAAAATVLFVLWKLL
jgi:hypothetical protein